MQINYRNTVTTVLMVGMYLYTAIPSNGICDPCNFVTSIEILIKNTEKYKYYQLI